jgi:poly(3-hydroxybutyrate) depolymerase
MNIKTLIMSVLSMGIAVNAQQVNLRGKVSDGAGKGIANAIVELTRLKHKDTTGTDGTFSLNFVADALRRLPQAQFGDIALERGVLVLSVASPAPMKVEVFDAKGNLLDRKALDKASAGVYRLDLGRKFPAGTLLIVKASLGNEVKTFQFFQTAGGDRAADISFGNSAPAGARLAKIAAVIDTLKVSAPGFSPKTVVLSTYDSTVNVTLEASSGDYWGGLKNPPGNSAGCGKATTVTSGNKTIMSGGVSRAYIIDIPTGYDMNKPYKFFYCSHWIGAQAKDVSGQNYYFLKPLATTAKEPAIFLAPQALPGNPGGTWDTGKDIDQVLFDNLLNYVKENLCIDTTRVFATGFSFGGMMTYSLSENHQKKIRAAVGIAAANYNIYVPPKTHEPIAWMGTTGMGDGTCPWVNNDAQRRGAKYIALDHAKDNGCTIPTDVTTWKNGAHVCYDFEGCKPGYPVKACTFNGGHTNIQSDPGSSVNWIPEESWKFFMQF